MSNDLDIIKKLENKLGRNLQNRCKLNDMEQVIELLLHNLNLQEVPLEIIQLKKLQILDLNDNQLSEVPIEISRLQNLQELDLEFNNLNTYPMEMSQLKSLQFLNLSRNHLSEWYVETSKLKKLQFLDLSSNFLNVLPIDLVELGLEIYWEQDYSKNSGIFLENNPFKTPPPEIIKQGKAAIIEYYNALKNDKTTKEQVIIVASKIRTELQIPPAQVIIGQSLNESKLILIGDGGAGKTSLMKRLLGQDFNPQESQTHGININTLSFKYNDSNVKFYCWDFGGQQIMHATHQFFLSKRSLYLLVLDSRRETEVEYWLKHIQTFAENAPVIIVINKIDENPHFDLPQQRQLKQRYPNIKYIARISCKTQQGLNELKQAVENIVPNIELLNTIFPATWFKVKTAITEQAQKTNFASYENFVDICQANGITKESEQNTLINFLHDLGLILHFQDRWLRETNVINPQWITEAVYTIINAPQLAGHGKLHREQLKNLLDNEIYPERKHDYILELMRKFELCYVLNDNEYLLPDLFPNQEPDFDFDDEEALHFILEYDFLPKSIFTRFIVRMHQHIVNNTYWRNGILLCDSNSQALIETIPNQKCLILQITGQQKREYLTILLFIIKDINRSFNQLKITEKIGLPDNPQITVNYSYLQKLAQNGQTNYLPPENPEKSYKISDLLGIVASPARSESEVMQMLQKILNIIKSQDIKEEKDLLNHVNEVVKLNPGLFGVSIDVNALIKKLWRKEKT